MITTPAAAATARALADRINPERYLETLEELIRIPSPSGEEAAIARYVAERLRTAGVENVEFRLGEIEHLPVADGTVDAIISNCVVNLVPDKAQVFAEAFRVLKPGGRLSVSDIVLLGEVPLAIRESVDAYVACLSGAILRSDYLALIEQAGFTDVSVNESRTFTVGDVVAEDLVAEFAQQSGATIEELQEAAAMFQSIRVQARKP
jgi:SAM-dependent methyltransferase